MTQKVKIILIEDNRGDANFIKECLSTDPVFEMKEVTRLSDALQTVSTHTTDIALLDLQLPDSEGIETFVRLRNHFPALPIVIVSGQEDADQAYKCIQMGAQDYLFKSQLNETMLQRVLRYTRERYGLVQQLMKKTVALEKSQANLESAYQALKATQKELIQSEKFSALGRFSIGLAHEVKNPLAIIMAGIEFMESGALGKTDDVRLTLEKIKEAVIRAGTVVNNLLRVGKPSHLEKQNISPTALMETTLGLLKYNSLFTRIKVMTHSTLPRRPW